MSFRFFRRVRILPGVSLNLSKSGASVSVGPRGAKYTFGGSRGSRATVGLPGTGMFYTKQYSKSKRSKKSKGSEAAPAVAPEDRLSLGFFQRLVTPKKEEHFVDACRELHLGNEDAAYEHFLASAHDIPDSAFMAGMIAFKRGHLDDAANQLESVLKRIDSLGSYFQKYGITASTKLSITPELSARVDADRQGILLALVEVNQAREQWSEALGQLEQLRAINGNDILIRLSLAELLMSISPTDRSACQEVLSITKDLENEDELETAMLLYRAMAMRGMELLDAARQTLTLALRRKSGRPEELLHEIRYLRALVYEDLGQKSRSRKDLERLYVEAPEFEDVAERLGVG